jgi:hypothetical protein
MSDKETPWVKINHYSKSWDCERCGEGIDAPNASQSLKLETFCKLAEAFCEAHQDCKEGDMDKRVKKLTLGISFCSSEQCAPLEALLENPAKNQCQ